MSDIVQAAVFSDASCGRSIGNHTSAVARSADQDTHRPPDTVRRAAEPGRDGGQVDDPAAGAAAPGGHPPHRLAHTARYGSLPQTSLWFSNAGRFYPPRLSRHRAVLGIEETLSHFADGHRAAIAPNELTAAGYRTALTLDPAGEKTIRYACGAIPADPGWTEVVDIALGDGRLTISDVGGASLTVPFDAGFFAGD